MLDASKRAPPGRAWVYTVDMQKYYQGSKVGKFGAGNATACSNCIVDEFCTHSLMLLAIGEICISTFHLFQVRPCYAGETSDS